MTSCAKPASCSAVVIWYSEASGALVYQLVSAEPSQASAVPSANTPIGTQKIIMQIAKRCLIYVFSYRASYYRNMYTPYRTYRIYCFYFNHIRSSAQNQPIFLSSFLNFTLLFTTRIKNPHSRCLRKCGFNFYEFIRFSYGLKRISPYRRRRRSQTESSSCRQNQNFPPPPPWVVPEDDVCVAEPPEESLSFGFAVRFTCE